MDTVYSYRYGYYTTVSTHICRCGIEDAPATPSRYPSLVVVVGSALTMLDHTKMQAAEDPSYLIFGAWDPDKKCFSFWERVAQLKAFIKMYGHCRVPRDFYDIQGLSNWTRMQRQHYRKMLEGKPSSMTQERLAALEEVGFVWDAHQYAWEENIRELKLFKAQYGHCRVPSTYSNKKLLTWVRTQRVQINFFNQGKPSLMTKDRKRELIELGFLEKSPNTPGGRDYKPWDQRFQDLKDFHKKFGHSNVTKKDGEEYTSLASWCRMQRTAYNCKMRGGQGMSKRITPERIQKLESIGFRWESTEKVLESQHAEARLAQMKSFRKIHGHCNVPFSYKGYDSLGSWVSCQRRRYQRYMEGKGTTILPEFIEEFKRIGFEWDSKIAKQQAQMKSKQAKKKLTTKRRSVV